LDDVRTRASGEKPADLRKALAETMDVNAQVFRTEESLTQALDDVRALAKRYRNVCVRDKASAFNTDLLEAIELGFLLDLAEVVVLGALNRKESRGGHFREDYPKRDDANYMRHTLAYRRPLADKGDDGDAKGPFALNSESDGYRIIVGSKPVIQTRYQPMERKY
jgi:succinate dehydrogenase / fumarate reductase flavoprotein subunit